MCVGVLDSCTGLINSRLKVCVHGFILDILQRNDNRAWRGDFPLQSGYVYLFTGEETRSASSNDVLIRPHLAREKKRIIFRRNRALELLPELMSLFCVAEFDKAPSHFKAHNSVALGQQQQTGNSPVHIR